MTGGGRWTHRNLPAEFRDTRLWRHIDLSLFSEDEKSEIERLKGALVFYLATGKLRDASTLARVSPSTLLYRLNRCVTTTSDGRLAGWTALLPGFRLGQYTRRAALPHIDRPCGDAGSFESFLRRHPDIKEILEALILNKKHKALPSIRGVKTTKSIHDTFVRLCLAKGITKADYPLNSRSQARRSVQRFIHATKESNVAAGTAARHGKEAAGRLRVGTGYHSPPQFLAPYDMVALDAHEIHAIGSVRIMGPSGPQRIAIERFWYIAVLDFFSRAILGYSLAIRPEPSGSVIEEAIIAALTRWEPRNLSMPSMLYKPGASLPSATFPQLCGCAWHALSIDNAAAHFANAIVQRARKRIGCALTYGSVAHWEHRAHMERAFRTLELYGFQGLTSSTGSNTQDPLKGRIGKTEKIGR